MGLDMYLYKMPRYRGATARDVDAVESYLDYVAHKEGNNTYDGTFKDWCGLDKYPSQKYIDFYSYFYTKDKYGFGRIMEKVGYWRKANHIHNWFVENIQDGEDDCDYYREVTEDDFKELLNICKIVLDSCEMVDGKINVGTSYSNGKVTPIMEDGQYVKDPSVAKELLPCVGGFFFGGTEYDMYYVECIKDTIDIITEVLETTNFDKEMIYYRSSW